MKPLTIAASITFVFTGIACGQETGAERSPAAPPKAPPGPEQAAVEKMDKACETAFEKGDPVALFQLSLNKEGIISGAYQSTLTDDKQPVAGKVDKATQTAAWRVGENRDNIYTTTVANLTQDVCTVAIHFSGDRVQEWLLVRMPAPPAADQPAKAPEMNRKPPPATPISVPK